MTTCRYDTRNTQFFSIDDETEDRSRQLHERQGASCSRMAYRSLHMFGESGVPLLVRARVRSSSQPSVDSVVRRFIFVRGTGSDIAYLGKHTLHIIRLSNKKNASFFVVSLWTGRFPWVGKSR